MSRRQRRARNRALRRAGILAPAWLDALGDLFGYTVLPPGALTTLLKAARCPGLEAEALLEHERESHAAARTKATEALKLAGEILTERTMAHAEIDVLLQERDQALAALNHGDH